MERDADKRSDQEAVLNYVETYDEHLVGHVIPLEGRAEPLLVPRTNNVLEHLFGTTKQGLRRKVGTKKLTRYIQAMRPEALLVPNLKDPVYLELVCGGSLANLPACLSEHWQVAQAIRRERQKPKTDHPMPTSKKQLRQPTLLDKLQQLANKVIEKTSQKTAA